VAYDPRRILARMPIRDLGLTRVDCAYMLKYVERTRRDIPDRPWSERQTTIAIHNGEVSRWVLVSPSIAMQKYLDRYMCALKDNEHENPFAIHLLFIAAAMINWPAYLAYLTAETQEEVSCFLDVYNPSTRASS
jgi:hypothetical protein